jgi:hypothetical protein
MLDKWVLCVVGSPLLHIFICWTTTTTTIEPVVFCFVFLSTSSTRMPTHGERDASEQLYREIREKEKRRMETFLWLYMDLWCLCVCVFFFSFRCWAAAAAGSQLTLAASDADPTSWTATVVSLLFYNVTLLRVDRPLFSPSRSHRVGKWLVLLLAKL